MMISNLKNSFSTKVLRGKRVYFKWLYPWHSTQWRHLVLPFVIYRFVVYFTFVYCTLLSFVIKRAGALRVVVSTAAFHARVRGSVPGLGGLKETKNVSSPSTCESQYCGEPPWPRGSVLGLRPPGLEFRILCLEDSVISLSSRGSPGPV